MAEGQRPADEQTHVILNEHNRRTQGLAAQTATIAGGKALAETVRTTLGPRISGKEGR